MNMALYKYRIQLMDMLGIALKSAIPARSIVVFSLLQSAPGGVFVKESTPLLAQGKNDNRIVFATDFSVYVTNAAITDVYAISGGQGKISKIYKNRYPRYAGVILEYAILPATGRVYASKGPYNFPYFFTEMSRR
jgi:hypothetical protein